MEHPLEPLLSALHKVGERIASNTARIVKLLESFYDLIKTSVEEIVHNISDITVALFEIQIINHISKLEAINQRLLEEQNIVQELENEAKEQINELNEKFKSEAKKLLEKRNENIKNLCKYIFDIFDEDANFIEDKLLSKLVFTNSFEHSVIAYALELERSSINNFLSEAKNYLKTLSTVNEENYNVLLQQSTKALDETVDTPTFVIFSVVKQFNIENKRKKFLLPSFTQNSANLELLDSSVVKFLEKFDLDRNQMNPVTFEEIKKFVLSIDPSLKEKDLKMIEEVYRNKPWSISSESIWV